MPTRIRPCSRGVIRVLGLAILLFDYFALAGCRHRVGNEVILYSSIDETYALAIGAKFRDKTGIEVRLLSDSEETKSTGLLNRLLAERARPVADVFWSGDIMRAAILKRHGLAARYDAPNSSGSARPYDDSENQYVAGSARLRLILYNQARAGAVLPESILDLAKPEFAPRACFANPLFGTTSMHAAALFELLGDDVAARFFKDFRANGGRMLSSNGEVRRRVSNGEFAFGLTDSDDVSVALTEHKPVGFIIPDQSGPGAMLIPSATVLLKGAPHLQSARQLVDFLNSSEVEEMMAQSTAAHFPLRPELAPPPVFGKRLQEIKLFTVDYARLAARTETLQTGFLKKWVETSE
jgi:iron(III) transport system substrate-binding protein